MPYAVVRVSRPGTTVPVVMHPALRRLVARDVRRDLWRRGFRGFGQADCISADGTTLVDCSTMGSTPLPSGGGVSCPAGSYSEDGVTCIPLGGSNTVGGLPVSPVTGAPVAQIGSTTGCAAGYAIADASGNCAPIGQVITNLGTPAGQAAAGLTAAQAATIAAALKAGTTIAQIATGQPVTPTTSYVAPASATWIPGLSNTTVLIGGVAFFGLLLLMSSKKR